MKYAAALALCLALGGYSVAQGFGPGVVRGSSGVAQGSSPAFAGPRPSATAVIVTRATEVSAAVPEVTFTKDVAPLLIDRCGMCHHPGGSAPFSLLTYADAKRHAAQIPIVTAKRFMPPWKADPADGPFIGQHPLTDAEIQLLRRWESDGAPEGDPADMPPPRAWSEGWQLGKPDLVLTLPQAYTLQADGTDVFRIFVLPIPVDAVRFVRGLEFRPGNPKVVHHANIRVDKTPTSKRLDEADAGARLHRTDRAHGRLSRRAFSGLDSGAGRAAAATRASRGVSRPGPTSLSSCTCSRAGRRRRCRPRRPVLRRRGADADARDAAAGAPGHRHSRRESAVHDHRHVRAAGGRRRRGGPAARALPRARRARRRRRCPDGTTRPLIDIADWDFRWQHVYRYVDAASPAEGDDAVDAVHVRQLGGQPAQSAAAAGARVAGASDLPTRWATSGSRC